MVWLGNSTGQCNQCSVHQTSVFKSAVGGMQSRLINSCFVLSKYWKIPAIKLKTYLHVQPGPWLQKQYSTQNKWLYNRLAKQFLFFEKSVISHD